MNGEFIMGMQSPLVVTACLIIGYIAKKWLADVNNNFIPTIVCVSGIIIACVLQKSIDVQTIVSGAISGLASTGSHEAFANFIEYRQSYTPK